MNEVVFTSDNSTSVHSQHFDALYHSKHGAIQESMHVFINAGLDYYLESQISTSVDILEIGYGTGLNALLTCQYMTQKENIHCNYTGMEAYPINKTTHDQLNYGKQIKQEKLFDIIFNAEWNKRNSISDQFSLNKRESRFEELNDNEAYDIIYFDAFAPSCQPHLWEEEILKKMYSATKYDGILVTYCAKGIVRRTLQAVGYEVDRIPGPPGKRQMMRATKKYKS